MAWGLVGCQRYWRCVLELRIKWKVGDAMSDKLRFCKGKFGVINVLEKGMLMSYS